MRPAKYFQTTVGLSSIEEVTEFSRASAAESNGHRFASNQDESMSALVVLDAKVSTSKSALSVR